MDKEQMSAWLWNEILKSEPEAEITDAVIDNAREMKKLAQKFKAHIFIKHVHDSEE